MYIFYSFYEQMTDSVLYSCAEFEQCVYNARARCNELYMKSGQTLLMPMSPDEYSEFMSILLIAMADDVHAIQLSGVCIQPYDKRVNRTPKQYVCEVYSAFNLGEFKGYRILIPKGKLTYAKD